ncbi:hypothetical protein ACTXT7_004089 [Hymenolepis weldensis]
MVFNEFWQGAQTTLPEWVDTEVVLQYKRKRQMSNQNSQECQFLSQIPFSASLIKRSSGKAAAYVLRAEKRRSNHPDPHRPQPLTLSQNHFHSAVAKHSLV